MDKSLFIFLRHSVDPFDVLWMTGSLFLMMN